MVSTATSPGTSATPRRQQAVGARDWAAASVGALFLLYAVLRAAALPILFDEAFTYLSFVREPLGSLLNPLGSERPIDANNHILNTLLVKACVGLFGTSEFVFRIPNLAALASYLIFVWMLLRRTSRTLPPLAGFILICANPFLLDLFSVARGYGLSLGLLLPALYLLVVALEVDSPSREREILIFLLLSAATLASYLLLNVYAAALVVWLAVDAIRLSGKRARASESGRVISDLLRRNTPALLISAGLAAAVAPVIFALRQAGGFYWGGVSGFWPDTVRSLVRATLYRAPYAAATEPLFLGLVAAAAAIIALVCCFPFLWRTEPTRMRVLTGISAVTGLSVIVSLLEHALLGVKFPIDRMGTFLVPLFLISLWLALDAASGAARPLLRSAARVAVLILAAACLAHIGRVGGVRVSYLWQYDLDTPEMLRDLARLRLRPAAPADHVRLGITPFLTPGIDYYRVVQSLTWLAPMNQSGPWGDYDFIYIQPFLQTQAVSRGYRILRSYPRTGSLLCAPPSPR